jgi:hypothetical protein
MNVHGLNRVNLENLTPFEVNVIEVALTHLEEMHSEILNEDPNFSGAVILTCRELLKTLNDKY